MQKTSPSLFSFFHISLLVLFVELMLIRWVSTEVNIFAYLQNSILICCFLGLGMGLLSSHSSKSLPGLPSLKNSVFSLCALTCLLTIPPIRESLELIGRVLNSMHDFLVWDQAAIVNQSITVNLIAVFVGIAGTFLLLYLVWNSMLPLGVLLGKYFAATSKPLSSYSADILGSLFGIWLFGLLAIAAFPPYVWLIVAAILFLPLLLKIPSKYERIVSILSLVIAVTVAIVGHHMESFLVNVWTPYQKISMRHSNNDEFEVFVNNSSFQAIQNNSPEFLAKNPQSLPAWGAGLSQYDIPARLNPEAKEILIVGAGTGNDVAGLLRNSKANITAVEIDPKIIELGRQFHPEHPYDSPRVTVVAEDARAFFAQSKKHFDIIVFGLLDSHTTSVMTNARLDNFVYTEEALSYARSLLTWNGVLVLIFQPQRNFIKDRFFGLFRKVFKSEPLSFSVPDGVEGWGGLIFVGTSNDNSLQNVLSADPALDKFIGEHATIPTSEPVYITHDDWPYLYLKEPHLPLLFGILGGLFIVLWLITSKKISKSVVFPDLKSPQMIGFFSLGIGFSMVEVYGICRVSLLFGSTWIVSSLVITGVLIFILLANYLASLQLKLLIPFATFGVLSSCMLLYAFDFSRLLTMPYFLSMFCASMLVGLPALFSGLLFAWLFEKAPQRNTALGANLFGALVGGVLQVLTFRYGISSLMLIALFAYFITAIAMIAEKKKISSAGYGI